ncbi:carbohydrate ABC transporter permease [Halobaculum magnesiiphilum]|uniref:Carbohydrate ABC transporter permease n=1 Tax=Halobaculum magnesiiphilum TaxID=1017351 RepID=A0A8T8WC65_9EURY|nr:carbohydrate ABC transporter permease [Halobaculum magnesiiphilum]QZP37429.1 carbohydrate ABC transporter permease [Halobaculum magnesiiphilum]
MATDDGRIARATDNAIRYPTAVYRLLFVVATGFFLLFALFPLYWLLVVSVTPTGTSPALVPAAATPANYLAVAAAEFLRYVFNSLVIAGSTTVVVVVVAALAGYAFGRLEFPGKRVLLLITLCVAYFPPVAFVIPLFRLLSGALSWSAFGVTLASPDLFNTPAGPGVPLTGLTMPLAIFVLTTFFDRIPDTLEDAARVEGTTRLGALVRVIVPLSRPGIATAAVLTFLQVYTEFFFSLLMTNGDPGDWAPIVPPLRGLAPADASFAAAAAVTALLPVILLLALADDHIVAGLTTGYR